MAKIIPKIDINEGIAVMLSDSTVRTVTVFCQPLNRVTQRVRITRRKEARNTLIVTYGPLNFQDKVWVKGRKKAKKEIIRFKFDFFPRGRKSSK